MNHKGLDVWKVSIDLVPLVYKLTEAFPKSEHYGLVNQMRRSAVSIPSNT
ncbi:four helix bundle protein [Psychroflexus sp. CAK8W]|uniref:Four helix bundle protein n=1 Tax=Psychroflexus longus TaxID=2873596 RepID=A0ABS7XKB3_9FLAO|nr:four helix bundle protein [Psychroflexus longus]MBZ9779423.1 four helix bundle protein [Psychroflexus longus]